MKAAIVTSFGSPPRYGEFPDPVASGPHELVVEVLACGLHPRVLSQADGSHYTSTAEVPLVPGVDGVGRAPDGSLRYFVLHDTLLGAMAERTVIDTRRSVVLPEGSDPLEVAAAMNPAMSSWIALRHRTDFRPGQDVLVLGATGNAGRMAIQVAQLFGAGRIVAAGRNAERLALLSGLGATETLALDGDALAAAADVDIVLDYVWGESTAAAMSTIVTARTDRGRPLTWVEIGSVGGPTAAIPSAALRSTRLQIVGSGQGSVSTAEIVAELAGLAEELARGTLSVRPTPVPLSDVEQAWVDARHPTRRIVVTP